MIGAALGRYEILGPLGAGGMGEVYRALDPGLGRRVAIKVLPAAVSADQDRVERLRREAQLLAALNHPNVASIYSMDEHDGTLFLVLELIEGESLREMLRRGPVPIREALAMARQIADALKAAHDQGIVHRDLKPANVMVTEVGARVKVLDFGIAKALGPLQPGTGPATGLTETGATLGTTAYMSPEQLRGVPVDHRSDVWSMGCLVYEMLAGRNPFSRPTGPSTVAAILEAEPDWGALPAATPEPVRATLGRCLERDPALRYADASRVGRDLEAAGSSGGRARPRWGPAALAGAAVVALLGLWASGIVPGGPTPGPSEPSSPVTSLAVLPFSNLSGDPGLEYIAVAMTEMLTTELGSLGSLTVSGRESAIEFAGSDAPSTEIANRLEVDALVRGSLMQIGDNVVIAARLVDARVDEQLWTDRYEGTALEIFGLTSTSVEAIAREVGALTSDAQRRLASARPMDPRAEQLFWRGFTELENYTEDAIRTAINAFTDALALEPGYAMAHAELSRAYALSLQFGYMRSAEALPLVQASAERALDIDPTLAEARVALARLRYQASRDWTGIEETLAEVVAESPSSVGAWHWYSHVLTSKLKLDQSIEAARRGHEVDPLSRTMWLHLSQTYGFARRWADVVAIADSTLELYPDYNRIRGGRAAAYQEMGRSEEAISEYEALVEVSREPDNLAGLAVTYARAGREMEARALLAELSDDGGGPWRVGRVYTALGELDLAFEWLSRAVDEDVGQIADLAVFPGHDVLRADTVRWRALLRQAGFPEELVAAEVPRG